MSQPDLTSDLRPPTSVFSCPFCRAALLRQQDRGSFYYHPPSRECAMSNEGLGLDRWTRIGKAHNQGIDRKLTKPVVTHLARESVVVQVSEQRRAYTSHATHRTHLTATP